MHIKIPARTRTRKVRTRTHTHTHTDTRTTLAISDSFGFDFGFSFEAKTAKQKANTKASRQKCEASCLEAVWSGEGRVGIPLVAANGGGGGACLSLLAATLFSCLTRFEPSLRGSAD